MTYAPPPPTSPYAQPMSYATPPAASADERHISLLSIFHFVWGGLTALASSLGLIHVALGIMMLVNPASFSSGQPPPPAFVGWMFLLMGGAIVLLGWTLGGLTIYSGVCMRRRKRHTFSIVIAAINCLSVPVGTALGVFTLVVLLRASVKAEYEYRRTLPA
jgi:uncharacterized membrane protein YedE/YeeE